MQIADIAGGPGAFFKGAEYYGYPALLVEVLKFEGQRPGNFGPKDTIHANIHAFASQEDIEKGNATFLQGALIQSASQVRELIDLVGQATVVKTEEVFFKKAGKNGPVFRQVDPATKAKVVEYATAYFARVEAEADEAPDLDDLEGLED